MPHRVDGCEPCAGGLGPGGRLWTPGPASAHLAAVSGWQALREQIRRIGRDPARLARLHRSTALAAAHLLLEPDERGVLARLFDVPAGTFASLERDLVGDAAFRDAVATRHAAVRGVPLHLLGATPSEDDHPRWRLLYYAVRLLRPAAVIETGVFDGISTCFLLKALADNGAGRLVSIDVPPRAPVRASTDRMRFTALPAGCAPGWLVPDRLRERWTLELGSSRERLPACLARLGAVDVFFHDSLHTATHMRWEMEAAWPALAPGGLLASDDVFWNAAFWSFCRRHGVRGMVARGMGMVRKPPAAAAGAGVSVRPGRLRAGAAGRRSSPAVRFSVVVPVGTQGPVRVLSSLDALPAAAGHELIVERGRNPSRNRNRGIARARGDILAFTDDDCVVPPDWLSRAAAFFDAHPECDVMGGPQLTPPGDGPVARASGHVLASRLGAGRMSRRYRRGPTDLAAAESDLSSANLFVRRTVFERCGPFDPRLWPNEETELFWRVRAAGGTLAYDPSVIVYHHRRPSLPALAAQCFRYGGGRARQGWLTRTPPGAAVLVPLAFLAYATVLPALGMLHPALLLPLAAWAAMAIGSAVAVAVGARDPLAAVLVPACTLVVHLAYPAGFACEVARLCVRGGRLDEIGRAPVAAALRASGQGAGR